MENYLTIKEVSEILKYNQEYVRRLIRKGYIQAFKLGSGSTSQYRVLETEIERLQNIGFERTLDALKARMEREKDGTASS